MLINDYVIVSCLLILFDSTCQRRAVHGLTQHGQKTTDCGGVFEADKGVLQTPNFPGPYPTPIYCEWIIHAERGKKIIIYFTQFYMNDSFQVSEYEYYHDTKTYVGKNELGKISWKHDLSHLVAYEPYVLIQFEVDTIANRHIRVVDHLLEVYGFNITYEIVDKNDSTKKSCSVKECSYLGNCIVSQDFSTYECRCFEDFFGTNCQYGPYCDPDNGINQCLNGGRCKYFFGSLINQCECPPDYTGAYCDVPAFGNGPLLPKECQTLQCSQLCEVDEFGQAFCFCYDGYKMDVDNGTCIPIARYRLDVTLELEADVNAEVDNTTIVLAEAATEIQGVLEKNGITTITRFKMKGIKNMSGKILLQFDFYCKVSEVEKVQEALSVVVETGTVGILDIKSTAAIFEQSPELVLSEVSNFDPNPTLRGTLLTLVCAAKGSKNIQFEWFRNQSRLDTSLTQRDTWETKVPHSVHGMLLSVLNIDNVTPLDAGKFTCNVTDFGDTLSGSVEVNVYDYPKVELDFMSISIPAGETISVKCISHDDGWNRSNYQWYKDNVLINHKTKNAYVEDIYPTGVRLVVPRVRQTAEYTCKVSNHAGSANVTAYVYSIPANETDLMCEKNYYGQVMWNRTACGHFDVKRCPADQGGYTTRACKCDPNSRKSTWAEPNFAKCQSLLLIGIYDQLQLLRFGYQITKVQAVFRDLYSFIEPKKVPVMLYPGDIDMVSSVLKEMVRHIQNFPAIISYDPRRGVDERIPAQRLLELMSMILDRSHHATPEEKAVIKVGTRILQTVDALFTGGLRGFSHSPDDKLHTATAEMKVETLPEVTSQPQYSGTTSIKAAKILRERSVTEEERYIDTTTFVFGHLADLLKYKDEMNNKDARHYNSVVSRVHSVATSKVTYRRATVRLTMDHNTPVDVSGTSTTTCLSWNTRSTQGSFWTPQGCTVVRVLPTATVCDCDIPGHFLVARVLSNRTIQLEDDALSGINRPLLIGYSFSLLILCAALIIYIKTFCDLVCGRRTLVLCSILDTVAFVLVSLLCIIYKPEEKNKSRISLFLLMYFYMAAFSSLTLEAFNTFARAFNCKRLFLTSFKWFVCCTGLPIVFMIPPIIITAVDSSPLIICHKFCWLSSDMKLFYAFIFPVTFQIMVFGILSVLTLCKLRCSSDTRQDDGGTVGWTDVTKPGLIFVLLTVSTFLATDIKSPEQDIQIVCHVLALSGLCFSVLLFRCILDKRIRSLLGSICFGSPSESSNQEEMKKASSFRAFVKPESNGTLSQEEYNVSQYYDEINRTKYTSERRRQLSSLLGSAAGSMESTTDTKSMSITTSSSSREGEIQPVPSLVRCQLAEINDNDLWGNHSNAPNVSNGSQSSRQNRGADMTSSLTSSVAHVPKGRSRNVNNTSDVARRRLQLLEKSNTDKVNPDKDLSKAERVYKPHVEPNDPSGASSAHSRNLSPTTALRNSRKLEDISEVADVQTVLSDTSASVFPPGKYQTPSVFVTGAGKNRESSSLLIENNATSGSHDEDDEAAKLL